MAKSLWLHETLHVTLNVVNEVAGKHQCDLLSVAERGQTEHMKSALLDGGRDGNLLEGAQISIAVQWCACSNISECELSAH